MAPRDVIRLVYLCAFALSIVACGRAGLSGGDTPIKSTKSGNLTITLSNPSGELRNGENDLLLSFSDEAGKPVEVGAASLAFHMPSMGSMAEMNDGATLTTTETPGKYRAKVDIEMAGTWEALVAYQGPNGEGRTRMSVTVK